MVAGDGPGGNQGPLQWAGIDSLKPLRLESSGQALGLPKAPFIQWGVAAAPLNASYLIPVCLSVPYQNNLYQFCSPWARLWAEIELA